ncbi:MAG: radical SAM protein [Planctomycetota bacterium]
MPRLETWLRDPFLARLYRSVRVAGPLRSIALDLTETCNLRCVGCYFFAEGMDRHRSPRSDAALEAFIRRERARGTNFVTVVGGEPSLELGRLKKLHGAFRLSVASNGTRRIPREGFENLPIGLSVWGDHASDRRFRGGGRLDVFARGLANYRDDPRAFWYYTVAQGRADEIESVVEQCVANGNRVLFNFYSDLAGRGGELDHRRGFAAVREAIDRMIERYPERILMTSRLARVVSSGRLFAERWGHATCTSISPEHPANRNRVLNGKPYNPHLRAYNADLTTIRRCCTAADRGCDACLDTWQHFSWVMLNPRKHLGSEQDFTEWLGTTWLFYYINRLVDSEEGAGLLAELQRRSRAPSPLHA